TLEFISSANSANANELRDRFLGGLHLGRGGNRQKRATNFSSSKLPFTAAERRRIPQTQVASSREVCARRWRKWRPAPSSPPQSRDGCRRRSCGPCSSPASTCRRWLSHLISTTTALRFILPPVSLPPSTGSASGNARWETTIRAGRFGREPGHTWK